MKKKGFTLVEMIAVVIIIAIIAVLAVPPVLQSIRGAKDEISDAMKKVIISASDIYMDADKDNYVRYNGNRYCITIKQLVEDERLSGPVYDPTTSKEISQDKFVQVDIFDNEYSYEIVDTCEEIRKHSLIYQLKQQYKEGNTTGLLKDEDGSYYYKGSNTEVANNFVWFGGHLWRVISINNDDTITMITQQPITVIKPASSAWTTKEEYEASYINHWLNSEEDGVFYKSLEQNDKNKIQDSIFNVGIYNNVSEITVTGKVGLLDKIQYTKAGEQNSFLDIKNYWIFGNRFNDSNVLIANTNGYPVSNSVTTANGVRPVIKISNLTLSEGKGTLENPYREKRITTNITNIKVGEYIIIPTNGTDCGEDNKCLFRVVSKANNAVKVTLNGLLPDESAFDVNSNVIYSSGNAVDTVITAFANTIDSKYRYQGNDTTFGIGTYGGIANYTVVQDTKYQGTVGLPVVGEMFTGNDINIGSASKTFVNINTIENQALLPNFLTMNACNVSVDEACHVNSYGFLSEMHAANMGGVRPVLFLKNNLKFTGGDGTAENPFTLE